MEHSELKELYVEELRDLFDAENRLVKALPKMAKAASSEALRKGFESHLEQTRGHVDRLKQILDALDEKPAGKTCAAMVGLIKEGQEMMEEDFEGDVMDAALISAAQRVEHYEMAGYGCVRTWAELLGEDEARDLLQETLDEEKQADQKLTQIAEGLTVQGLGESSDTGDESEEEAPRAKARSAKA